jgi:hypothetical protein
MLYWWRLSWRFPSFLPKYRLASLRSFSNPKRWVTKIACVLDLEPLKRALSNNHLLDRFTIEVWQTSLASSNPQKELSMAIYDGIRDYKKRITHFSCPVRVIRLPQDNTVIDKLVLVLTRSMKTQYIVCHTARVLLKRSFFLTIYYSLPLLQPCFESHDSRDTLIT